MHQNEFNGPSLSEASQMSPFQFSGSHSFPINALTLEEDILQCWEFNCFVIQPLAGWDSGLGFQESQLCSYRKWVFFRADIEAFRSFIQNLSWKFESFRSFFSFPTLSSNIRSKQPISLYYAMLSHFSRVRLKWLSSSNSTYKAAEVKVLMGEVSRIPSGSPGVIVQQ